VIVHSEVTERKMTIRIFSFHCYFIRTAEKKKVVPRASYCQRKGWLASKFSDDVGCPGYSVARAEKFKIASFLKCKSKLKNEPALANI